MRCFSVIKIKRILIAALAVLLMSGMCFGAAQNDVSGIPEDIVLAVNAASRNPGYKISPETLEKTPRWQKQFAMLCITDVHHQAERIETCIKYLNGLEAVDCGCCLGDINGRFSQKISWYVDALRNSTKPFYTVKGNHEIGTGGSRQKGATTEAIFNKYIKPVSNQIGIPNLKKSYYRVDWEQYGVTLIALDGYLPPQKTDKKGEFIYTGVLPYFGQEQISWLINELGKIPSGNSLVIMLHDVDFRTASIKNTFTQGKIGAGYSTDKNPYGQDGVVLDIIEAWRLGSRFEKTYVPKESTGLAETIRVKCDYTSRGKGDFVCWIAGHRHRDLVSRSKKYPAQLVLRFACAVHGALSRYSDLVRTPNTRAVDVMTVLVVDKVSRSIKLVRIGADITYDLKERKMASIKWDYSPEK